MLPQLIAFREVAEKRSFRAAAEVLNISQPALTLRIQNLEATLGFSLLDRDKGGVSLTPEGERFLPYARSSIQAVRDGAAEARRARTFRAVYRIISSYNLINVFVLAWVRRLMDDRPDVSVTLDCGYPDVAARLFSAGLVDITVTFEPIVMPGLISEMLYTDESILVTSCERLEEWRDHYAYVHWDDAFTEQHRALLGEVENNPQLTIYFLDVLRVWALSGPASGYMSARVAAPYLASGQFKRVPDVPVFQRPVYMTHLARPADREAHAAGIAALRAVLPD
jgi:LysR family transcriptional regulator, flagellar master operon regulator